MTPQLNRLLQEIKDHIVNNLGNTLSVAVICKTFFISKSILQDQFKEQYHLSVYAFILRERMDKARMLLVSNDAPVKSVAKECGYKKVRSFNKAFKNKTGLSPDQYRKENARQSIIRKVRTKVTP